MLSKNSMLKLIGVSTILLFSGCSTSNMFGVGYENSSCDSAKGNGFCGAPSSIYKYKTKVKQTQKNYMYSGYPDKLYFAISREGVIGVKEDRDDRWQPYEGSKFEKEINRLLGLKYKTNVNGVSSTAMDLPVGKNNDLSVKYKQSNKYLQTRTNVGRMIRDNGEYTRTWVAPYVDNKGDLISAHEIYSVIKNPEWVIGEKTPKKVIDAATPTPMSNRAYSVNTYKKRRSAPQKTKAERNTLSDFLNGK